MKRSAVVCHSLAMALAATAAGAALCAGPASAEEGAELSRVALAPLPEVRMEKSLFGVKRQVPNQKISAEQKDGAQGKDDKGKGGGEGKEEEDHGGKKGENCEEGAWEDARVRFSFFPIAYVHKRGYTLTRLIPNYPAGFPADHYSMYINPTFGLGNGLEVEGTFVTAKRFLGQNREIFYGGAAQQLIVRETGSMPAIAVGARGNTGIGHFTFASYIVATKKIIGDRCEPKGVYLTLGGQYERYTNPPDLLPVVRPGRPIPNNDDHGLEPFAGVNIALTDRFFVSGEWGRRQSWEFNNLWGIKGTLLLSSSGWGVEGGVRNAGWGQTRGFVSLVTGSFGPLLGRGRR